MEIFNGMPNFRQDGEKPSFILTFFPPSTEPLSQPKIISFNLNRLETKNFVAMGAAYGILIAIIVVNTTRYWN